jgi:hypothetical protein
MVNVNFDGRLGNNLFQLAAGLSLALDNNVELRAPTTYFYKFINYTPLQFTGTSDFKLYKEPTFHYTPIQYEPNILLSGYFQSEKYFLKNKDEVVSLLNLKDVYKNQIKEKYKDILKEETISLHVRRSDYLQLSHAHPVLPLEYYKNALEYIGFKDKKVLIFSDDMAWCKTAFVGSKFTYIEKNIDIVDMFLMSMCSHNIIANSSFSWWGAYFNASNNKKIVAPKNWFGSYYNNDTRDLYCSDWMVL